MGNLRAPVVPVAVHEVFRGIGAGLVKGGIGVRGHFHVAVDTLYVNHLGLVRRKEVVVYSAGDIGPKDPLPKLSVFVGGAKELPSLEEPD